MLVAVLATQAFPSWSTGIREQFAHDETSYEVIARAAPGLPSSDLPAQHAERFPVHWLAGGVARLIGVPLHDVYRALTAVLLATLLALVVAACRRLALDPATEIVCAALVTTSAYPFRYQLSAPGMVADALFLVGLAAVCLAFLEDRPALVCAGLLAATLGRQTAVPVAVAAAVLLWLARHRLWAAAAVAVTAGTLAVELAIASHFSQPDNAPFTRITVLGSLTDPRSLADHVGRIALPLVVPCAVVAGAWLRTRARPRLAPALLAAAVVVQPLLLGPDWVARNEPRLAGLALPALAIVAAGVLRDARLSRTEAVAIAAALVAASLHPHYTDIGIPDTAVWVALVTAGALVAAATLAVRPGRSAGEPQAAPGVSSRSTSR